MKIKKFYEYIKEGLIITHNITIYNRILTDYLDDMKIKYDINIIDKLKFFIEIYNNDLKTIEAVNHQAFTLGYFPASYKATLNNGMINKFKKIPNLSNVYSLEICYEAKYEDKLYKNDIKCPNKLYHLSYDDNDKSIMSKGLYPKSKKRISIHPERIYLFDDINNYNVLLNNLKISDSFKNVRKTYSLYEIDGSEDKFILHTDPNYRLGYFTYDCISPVYIKRIKDNL